MFFVTRCDETWGSQCITDFVNKYHLTADKKNNKKVTREVVFNG